MAADTYTCPGTYWTGMSFMSLSTIVLDPLVRPFLSPKCMIQILFYSCWSWTDDIFRSLRKPGLNKILFLYFIFKLNTNTMLLLSDAILCFQFINNCK